MSPSRPQPRYTTGTAYLDMHVLCMYVYDMFLYSHTCTTLCTKHVCILIQVFLWIGLCRAMGAVPLLPERCSDRSRCTAGNSATEPYLAGHHLLLAHAAAVKVYRNNFQQVSKKKKKGNKNEDRRKEILSSSVVNCISYIYSTAYVVPS